MCLLIYLKNVIHHQQLIDSGHLSYFDFIEHSNRTYRFSYQTNPNLDCTCRNALCCSEGNKLRMLKTAHPKMHPN